MAKTVVKISCTIFLVISQRCMGKYKALELEQPLEVITPDAHARRD